MITISDAVQQIIKNSPALEDGLREGIINCSSLARNIKPKVEEIVFKSVQTGAIIMALKRLSSDLQGRNTQRNIFVDSPDMIVRSNLLEYTFTNSESLIDKHKKILEKISRLHSCFFIITQGVFETTLILSHELEPLVKTAFSHEKVVSRFDMLSSITIKLPLETVTTPGVYGWILKSLDWEGINIVEVASTFTEFTIILKESDVDRAFSVLKKRLTKSS